MPHIFTKTKIYRPLITIHGYIPLQSHSIHIQYNLPLLHIIHTFIVYSLYTKFYVQLDNIPFKGNFLVLYHAIPSWNYTI